MKNRFLHLHYGNMDEEFLLATIYKDGRVQHMLYIKEKGLEMDMLLKTLQIDCPTLTSYKTKDEFFKSFSGFAGNTYSGPFDELLPLLIRFNASMGFIDVFGLVCGIDGNERLTRLKPDGIYKMLIDDVKDNFKYRTYLNSNVLNYGKQEVMKIKELYNVYLSSKRKCQ